MAMMKTTTKIVAMLVFLPVCLFAMAIWTPVRKVILS